MRLPLSYWQPFPDVSCVEPTVLIQGLCSPLWVFQVSLEDIPTLDTDLQTQETMTSR